MSPLFKCLSCGSSELDSDENGHDCRDCGAAYPKKLGVSLFLKEITAGPSGFEVSEGLAHSLCRLAGVEESAGNKSRLKEIFRYNYHLADLFLDSENNYYLERVRAAIDESVRDEGVRPAIAKRLLQTETNQNIRTEFTAHYIPRRLPAEQTVSFNVRFTNTGPSVISSDHERPIFLAYHWRDAEGQVIHWEGRRTHLLIDVVPGQSLTMPIFIQTPPEAGPAYLELTFVHEHVAWLEDSSCVLAVEIVPEEANRLPDHWQVLPAAERYDYDEDHKQGQQILAAEIDRLRRPGMRALELGGCCNPMSVRMGLEIVNVDIDVQTLQVGAIRPYPEDQIHWVASDAHDLPFVDESFDAIVIFATLHHFVDPIRVLRQLKPLLKKNGFLAIMCEPVGHNVAPPPEGMLNELNQGINEQAFSLQEYDLIFDQAGLEAYDLVAHGHSLKALLRPSKKPLRTSLAKSGTLSALPELPLQKSGWMDRLRFGWRRAG